MHHEHQGVPPFMAAQQHHGDFGPPFGSGPRFGRYGRGRGGRGGRASRGDIRVAILLLLNERPMHGYEIIAELDERTDGLWKPSPGSIYPTLSLLEDKGYVTSSEEGGKRRFSLTAAGSEQIANRDDAPPPWEEMTADVGPEAATLRKSGMLLFAAVAQVGQAGTSQQAGEAVTILDEARRRLYGLLAGSSES
jgi:DNA-binding PadR family transcriptional regulator